MGKGIKWYKKHVTRIGWELENPENKGHNTIKVKTNTLNNILEKHDLYNIDFCTIDTEGSEYEILKDFDFDKFNVDIFIVENNYSDRAVEDLMIYKNYKLIHKLEIDDIYKKVNK